MASMTPSLGVLSQSSAVKVQVLQTYPHDAGAFTQGLLLHDGTLYESTGLVGRSSLRQVELKTGRVLRKIDVPPPIFAEGLALVGEKLYQLTWQHGRVLVYNRATFGRMGEFAYTGEGWGLCYDGKLLAMTNGSDELTFRDPSDFSVKRSVAVTLNGRPLDRLNEVECVGGDIYANVWTTDTIVQIEAATGRVKALVDARGLLTAAERHPDAVLNGIAYDAADKTFLITGKLWPKLFRVKFVS
jgi:glutamine cyclotransferase